MDDTTKKPFWTEARLAAWEKNKEARMQGLLKAQRATSGPASEKKLAGLERSKEARMQGLQKANEATRGKPASKKRLAALQRLADARRGKPLSETHKQNDREALLKKHVEDPVFHEQQRQRAIKVVIDPLVRQKNSDAQQRLKNDPEYRQKNLAHLAAVHKANPSGLERQIKGLLDALGVEYIQQYQIDAVCVDFYLPVRHLVIEVQGCYWHGCEQCHHSHPEKQKADRRREYFIRRLGYNLYILWEHDMNDVNSKGMIGLMSRLEGGS